MAEASRTLDDDRQEDGWGITWLDDKSEWETYKSLNPVWDVTEVKKFDNFPATTIFLAHARSATFKSQLGNLKFNQPYSNGNHAFAFNGHLEGVHLDRPVKGKIGAEKIWTLTQEFLVKLSPKQALKELRTTMQSATDKIHGMNIVLSDKQDIYGLCEFTPNTINPTYYNLELHQSTDLKFICSEKLKGYESETIGSSSTI